MVLQGGRRAEHEELAWSRDQKYLLFVERRDPEAASEPGIYVMRVPVGGGPAEPTGIGLKGLPANLDIRNLSIDPDGRLFYEALDRSVTETWVLENFHKTGEAS